MDSLRRAFGRSQKSSEKTEWKEEEVKPTSPKKEHSLNASEDDIFSDMVINSTPTTSMLSSKNINDIQDLDVSSSVEVSKDVVNNDDAPSAFAFLNSKQKDKDEEDNISSSSLQENSKVIENKEISSSSDCKDLQKDLIKDETELSDRKINSISNFSFIREDEECLSVEKSDDSIQQQQQQQHSSPKPRNTTRKTRNKSTRPGFGNVVTEHPKGVSSSASVDKDNKAFSTSVSCGEDVHGPESACYNTREETAVENVPSVINDITEHNNLASKSRDGCIVDQTNDQTKGDVKTLDDFNTVDDTNSNNDGFTASEEDTLSIHLNEECVKENLESRTITMDSDSEQLNEMIQTDIKSVEYSNLESNISEDGIHQEHPIEHACIETCHIQDGGDSEEDLIGKSHPYNITEEEKVLLNVERLQAREEAFRKERSNSMLKQKELIDQWKSDHLSEDDIKIKIGELREFQLQLESKEDYDEAAEIDQTISELTEKCNNYKYQYPLLDEKFINLMKEYGDLCANQNREYEVMLEENQNIMEWFKTKSNEDELHEEKKLNDAILLLKEKKLKIERDLSHNSLDKEHLLKNEAVLSEEINKQTTDLSKEKEKLVEKRSFVQADIEELMAKLSQLREEESGLATLIVGIESKIQNIIEDFQPRIDNISKEKETVEVEEFKLKTELNVIGADEERIQERSTEIINKRSKTQEIISKISSSIEDIQRQRESSGKELFSFQDSLDLEGLKFQADNNYVKSKENLEEMQSKLKVVSSNVLADETKEKRLQRAMNDLEAQLAELQKLKQGHVKERRYKDAQMLSHEIKALTSKGESISSDALGLSETIKLEKIEMQDLNLEISKANEEFTELEYVHDEYITSNLKRMNTSINSLISRHPESWIVRILELTLLNNNNIIYELSTKHGLLCNEERCEDTVANIETIKEKLVELESALEIAVVEEDWDRAEEINICIEEKKKILENLM